MARLERRRRARPAAKGPRVSVCSFRTGDSLMGLPTTVPSGIVVLLKKEREPPELKHLSRGRKRNQNGIPLVAASEKGKVQTKSREETLGRCGVVGRLPLLPS